MSQFRPNLGEIAGPNIINMENKKLRILYIITKSNFGGAQRYVFELATAMKEAGHNVAVASAPTRLLVDKLNEFDIKHFPIHSFQRDISITKELRSIGEIRKYLKEFRPDVVHLNSSKAGGLGMVTSRLSRIPKIVFTAHGWPFLEPRSFVWRIMAWLGSYLTALGSHEVILVSANDKQKTFMPFVKNKCTVVNTAVPTINFLNQHAARQKLFNENIRQVHQHDLWLVTNAELNSNKNIFTAIDSVALYNQNHTKKIFYTIIGDGELETELNNYLEKKALKEFINIFGYLENARSYLKAFDCFLLTSKKEGLPYSLLEAGAAGLPIIASKIGGIPEVITDQTNGLLINPNSVDEITSALEYISTKKDEAEIFGEKIHNKIEKDFALEKMIKETETIYKA